MDKANVINQENRTESTMEVSKNINPFKNKKLLTKLGFFALLGPIGWLPLEGGATTLIKSNLGNLILLVVLVYAWYKIAIKNPSGWLMFAAFFYYGAFGHFGLTAWVYLGLCTLCLWIFKRWYNDSVKETNYEANYRE